MSGPALGIDLGTTNSVVAILDGGEPETLSNAEGRKLTPSVVAVEENGERLVGDQARNQAVQNPENTVASIKRQMGDDVHIELGDGTYRPEQISAMILEKLKRDAEETLEEEVSRAAITVPAYFNEDQRQATKDAGAIAGFDAVTVFSEPVAAAVAYGLQDEDAKTVLVVDLGGGTFDVSLIEQGPARDFVVETTAGDTELGGDDWDQAILDWIADRFEKEHGVDFREDLASRQRAQDAAEEAKQTLSHQREATVNLPFIAVDDDGQPLHLDETLAREDIEELTEDLRERLEPPIKTVIDEADVEFYAIDEVILVGGATRMPIVEETVRELTSQDPRRARPPDEVVARGAAIRAAEFAGEDTRTLIQDSTPFDLGIETNHGQFEPIIPRNSTIPAEESKLFTTSKDDQQIVQVPIYQSNRMIARKNRYLGDCRVTGLPPMPRGHIEIEVSFSLRRDGTLDVSVSGPTDEIGESLTIEDVTGLSDEEIEQMKLEAEQYAEEDQRRARLADQRSIAEQLLSFAKQLPQGELTEAERTTLQKASAELKETMTTTTDPDELEASRERFERAVPKRFRKPLDHD